MVVLSNAISSTSEWSHGFSLQSADMVTYIVWFSNIEQFCISITNSTWPWCIIILIYSWIFFFFFACARSSLLVCVCVCVCAHAQAHVRTHGLSPVAVRRDYSLLWCSGFSLQWPLFLSKGSRLVGTRCQQLWHTGSVVGACRLQDMGLLVVVPGLSCSTACGIFLDQGLNPCPLHWQVDFYPLHHQGSP